MTMDHVVLIHDRFDRAMPTKDVLVIEPGNPHLYGRLQSSGEAARIIPSRNRMIMTDDQGRVKSVIVAI